jgi:hypothetical protein
MESSTVMVAWSTDATVHRAQGVLAALLGVSIEDAAISLGLTSQFGGLSLGEAAQRILAAHTARIGVDGPPTIDDRALAILRQHLDSTVGPLDAETRPARRIDVDPTGGRPTAA